MTLRTVTATEHLGRAPQGSKNPHFFVCKDGKRGGNELLVKQMDSSLSVREVFGNLMAREFGLTTPRPYIVEMGTDIVRSVGKWCQKHKAYNPFSKGFAAGCDLVQITANLSPTVPVDPKHRNSLLRMFCFDMLVGYADRTADNPNCAVRKGKLLVYDFEQAFATDERFGEGLVSVSCPDPAKIAPYHCYYRGLKGMGKKTGFMPDAVHAIQRADWRRIVDDLPPEWRQDAESLIDDVLKIDGESVAETVGVLLG